ncbi:bifunctional adenosylcobinamide kinase/adenosylcobinamide-phosphate guanylyltransferase [Nocardioides sp. TRM66260-LWL]|uniref:bifunctional adenosylcobinamide kinase/adenosylcobinamide-phosphate guanylyltransferase n=1 Tax=Nocardioides sp. TRM66260-LWL TaxID=2874478 RepID=UPI001CC3F3E0|nr:bifunctional adenosylcobinamide kinase/adenosylcobinamide-phosphate guanylyltransferase [Nocardioides sp. TRM66260-LWL]MBZ5734065.1 bifunctional adenosylcobinamide kinase/adenosylcobinamide-phosphate guanylyltransferase [Nocardioides sp. TRM66260-LWL]
MRVLVTGGVRCGKSRHAESLLRGHDDVVYLAPGPVPEDADPPDPDWQARIDRHRASRPAGWTTRESADLAGALRSVRGALLVDCLGTWLTRLLDDGLWEASAEEVAAAVETALDDVVAALAGRPADAGPVVLVSNEVGWGVVPAHRSGRLFRDHLGVVNQRIAAVADEVHLVVAGRVLRL